MKKIFIHYKVNPEQASEVERLIRSVFDELGRTRPEGIAYSAQKLKDGQTFMHTYASDENLKNPMVGWSSFKELQEFIKVHPMEKPLSLELFAIDHYPSLH